MSNRNNKWQKLERKKFNEVISEAYTNYLNDVKKRPNRYSRYDKFHPAVTPNRNPEQVPNGTWHRLLYKYLHDYFNN